MSETNFTKLFSSITASTIWCEDSNTRVVWITMLAMADAAGFVYASIPGLANISQVPIKDAEKAIQKFLSPDKYSRDSENEGRRIEEIEGGWAILNHPKYRKLRDREERLAYQREYMRNVRKKKKSVNNSVTNVNNVSSCVPPLAKEEGEEENKNIVQLKPDQVVEVFQFWQETFNHRKAVLDDKRKGFIKKALKLYSLDDCKKAITGCSKTPHNMGENDRKQKYNGIHIIFKDADQIERFIGNAESSKNSYSDGLL